MTSYYDYLDEAMRIKAFRYLSKPISENRFYRCLSDAINELAYSDISVLVEQQDECFYVKSSEIIYIETKRRGSIIHAVKREIVDNRNITWWKEKLHGHNLYLVHRSFLVNMDYVVSFTHDQIVLCNGDTVFLSRRKYNDFKLKFVMHLERKG